MRLGIFLGTRLGFLDLESRRPRTIITVQHPTLNWGTIRRLSVRSGVNSALALSY